MSPSSPDQVQATRSSNRRLIAALLPLPHRPYCSVRACGCDTDQPSEGPATDHTTHRRQPGATRRTANRLLHEAVVAAAHGAAYMCGASSAGAALHWLIHR
ncbi:hypothetical protein ACM01_05060 [Streptomyces viridochromogenes]|uniref:Uncharacterized protein n=1 Tax=Streptomyces viridochromogenes TaxID=1938 RepID=A0A0J8CF32_STRVR|nr:hypothetical protein [Streptomyces viridochromogenes]KMS76550.1 hypothetical protein ACM01_05060 [Streptomyces viridochromogenes]KOG23328.1 hypothetical protein ADK35_13720 [Streptomyces viridochromogenes]KOG27066.1 hypothetical protein ADK36_00345 [Streptomyces viridochromogenes]